MVSLSPPFCVSLGLSLSPPSSPVTHCTHCPKKWVFHCWNSLPCALRVMTCTWAWLTQSWLWWVGNTISLTYMYIKAVVGFYLVHFVHSAVFRKLTCMFAKKASWSGERLSNYHCCNIFHCKSFNFCYLSMHFNLLLFLIKSDMICDAATNQQNGT